MNASVQQISQLLRQGLIASKQGSYNRRAAPGAVPFLQNARRELKSWIDQYGESEESLRLLALAEEALLHYDSAVNALERMMKLSAKPNRNDLKRLAACREASRMWRTLALTPNDLTKIGNFLKERLLDAAPVRSLQITEKWLTENMPNKKSEIISALKKLGYFSDYDVLHNLIPG